MLNIQCPMFVSGGLTFKLNFTVSFNNTQTLFNQWFHVSLPSTILEELSWETEVYFNGLKGSHWLRLVNFNPFCFVLVVKVCWLSS